jgi:beta-lactamase superfamily II metal-dependent hydrolase
MYEIDFLPVESASGPGSQSGDAIAMRFAPTVDSAEVVVIDGGFSDTGDQLVEHIDKYYETHHVDVVISTHPDADHLNGLVRVIEQMSVGELLIHEPGNHVRSVADFSNIEAVEQLIETARTNEVTVTEPFTGLTRLDGRLRILGPTEDYYTSLIEQHLEEARQGAKASARVSLSTRGDLLTREAAWMPAETLTDDVTTGARNNTSVITQIHTDFERWLFTGDAGIPALEYAADEYEAGIGQFYEEPLAFFQAPHHGSRHNLGPTILNRMFGSPTSRFGSFTSFISSARISTKHPSPKVVNALIRRGGSVFATEGKTICHHSGDAPSRPGWTTLPVIQPLIEDDDD